MTGISYSSIGIGSTGHFNPPIVHSGNMASPKDIPQDWEHEFKWQLRQLSVVNASFASANRIFEAQPEIMSQVAKKLFPNGVIEQRLAQYLISKSLFKIAPQSRGQQESLAETMAKLVELASARDGRSRFAQSRFNLPAVFSPSSSVDWSMMRTNGVTYGDAAAIRGALSALTSSQIRDAMGSFDALSLRSVFEDETFRFENGELEQSEDESRKELGDEQLETILASLASFTVWLENRFPEYTHKAARGLTATLGRTLLAMLTIVGPAILVAQDDWKAYVLAALSAATGQELSHRMGRGNPIGRSADSFPALQAACPTCLAPPGDWCVTTERSVSPGRRASKLHRPRLASLK